MRLPWKYRKLEFNRAKCPKCMTLRTGNEQDGYVCINVNCMSKKGVAQNGATSSNKK